MKRNFLLLLALTAYVLADSSTPSATSFSTAFEQLREEMRAEAQQAIAAAIAEIPPPPAMSVDLGETVVTDASGLRAAIDSKAGAIRIDGEILLTEPLATLAPLNLRGNKPGDGIKIGLLASGLAMIHGGKVESLRFSGDGGNVGDAILVGRQGPLDVSRCVFEDLGRGVALNGSASAAEVERVSVTGCVFKRCASPHDAAVYLNWNLLALTVRDNLFEDCGGGVWVGNLPKASGEIAGNTIRRYNRNGVELFFATNLSVTGNTVEDHVPGSEGIGISATGSGHRVIGNAVKNAGIIGIEHYGANIVTTGNRVEGLLGRPGFTTPCLGISVDAATDGLVTDNEVIVPGSVPKLAADAAAFAPPQTLACFAIQAIGQGGPTRGTVIRGNRLQCRTGVVVNYGCSALTLENNSVIGLEDGGQMQYAVVLYSGQGHLVRRNSVSRRGAHPFPNGFFTSTQGVQLYFDDTPTVRGAPIGNFYFGTNPQSTNLVLP